MFYACSFIESRRVLGDEKNLINSSVDEGSLEVILLPDVKFYSILKQHEFHKIVSFTH
jgi:hypothetical protein